MTDVSLLPFYSAFLLPLLLVCQDQEWEEADGSFCRNINKIQLI